jgi:hypothetical protein
MPLAFVVDFRMIIIIQRYFSKMETFAEIYVRYKNDADPLACGTRETRTHFPVITCFACKSYAQIPTRFLFGIAECCTFSLRNFPVVLNRTMAEAYDVVVVA